MLCQLNKLKLLPKQEFVTEKCRIQAVYVSF